MKFITLLMLTLVSLNAFSATGTTSTAKLDGSTKSKKKNFSLEFLLTSEQTKDIVSKKMDGTYTKFDSSLLQHLTKDDELRYFLATRYIDTKADDDRGIGNEFDMFFFELMYRRKNILTEANNGIYMEAELKNYSILDEKIKKNYEYNGAFIPQLIFKKSWGRIFGAKLKVRRHFYQANKHSSDYALNFEDRLYLSATAMLSRRSMLFGQVKYQHKMRKANGPDYRFAELAPMTRRGPDFSVIPQAPKHQEITTLHTGYLHFLTRQSMIEVYAETKLSNSYDKRDLETITNDEFVLGTALYLTAF